jgi:hypothetical protein
MAYSLPLKPPAQSAAANRVPSAVTYEQLTNRMQRS